MKSTISLIIILFSICVTAQTAQDATKFEYQEKGLNDYVITSVESKTADQIYSKTMNWIKETYKNPDEVLKMTIENQKVRINGIASNLLFVKKYTFPLEYSIEIAIKNGMYKFELLSLNSIVDGKTGADFKNVPYMKTNKRNIKTFGESPKKIENHLNSLNVSLKNYMESESDSNDEDW